MTAWLYRVQANGRYLADQEYSAENIAWCERHGIRICHIHMQSAKEPFTENDPELVAEALSHILDSRNYPLLVHSNKGKHRWYLHR
jgi:protein tyrosine/serine phosphatase